MPRDIACSRTAVSEITERLWAEYETFATRDFVGIRGYLPVCRRHCRAPASGSTARGGAGRLGILADGKKALLHLAPGTKEDTASCKEFFQDMRRRDLPDPLLVASDGAPGMIRAIEECLPRSIGSAAWRTRCETPKQSSRGRLARIQGACDRLLFRCIS
jgi:putative transposase